LVISAGVVGVLSGPGRGKSASQDGWQSGDLVGVKGEFAGTCAAAYSRTSYMLNGDQWIICGSGGTYRCYRQGMHALDFKQQPIRPSRFDADCRAALAVLRKAQILQ
jgi:hypothetical protein